MQSWCRNLHLFFLDFRNHDEQNPTDLNYWILLVSPLFDRILKPQQANEEVAVISLQIFSFSDLNLVLFSFLTVIDVLLYVSIFYLSARPGELMGRRSGHRPLKQPSGGMRGLAGRMSVIIACILLFTVLMFSSSIRGGHTVVSKVESLSLSLIHIYIYIYLLCRCACNFDWLGVFGCARYIAFGLVILGKWIDVCLSPFGVVEKLEKL